jgi:hypothetical protein
MLTKMLMIKMLKKTSLRTLPPQELQLVKLMRRELKKKELRKQKNWKSQMNRILVLKAA